MTKLPSRDANSFQTAYLTIADVSFLQICSCNESWIRVFPAKIIREKIMKKLRRQLQAPQYPPLRYPHYQSWSADNVGERTGVGRSGGSVSERIGKRLFCSQPRLTNRPAESLEFILAFQPHSDLLAGASNTSARPVCTSAGLLTRQVNQPASKPVRTYSLHRACRRLGVLVVIQYSRFLWLLNTWIGKAEPSNSGLRASKHRTIAISSSSLIS